MNDHHIQQLRKFCTFVRHHQAIWSHIGIAGLAVRAKGDEWLALWLTLLLGDSPIENGILRDPVLRENDIIAFRRSIPFGHLWPIVGDVLRGQIPAERVPGLPLPILVVSPPGAEMASISFYECLNHSGHLNDDAGGWPYTKIELQSGTLNDWREGHSERYERMNRAERIFGLHHSGAIGEFAVKLGATSNGSGGIWSAHTSIRIVAPLLARIENARHDRDSNTLHVKAKLGRLVSPEKLRVSVAYAEHNSQPELTELPTIDPNSEISFSEPIPGRATISLWHPDEGVISCLPCDVRPRHKAWPRSVVACLVDPEHAGLKADLVSAKSDQHERGVVALLNLLGYSPFWWPRGVTPQPAGVPQGMAPDILAFGPDDRDMLVVECTTQPCGDGKINKLHGRAERVRTAISESSGGGDILVSALLACGRPRNEIPPAVGKATSENGTGLLCQDDCTAVLEMIRAGRPRSEVLDRFASCFPSRRRMNHGFSQPFTSGRAEF